MAGKPTSTPLRGMIVLGVVIALLIIGGIMLSSTGLFNRSNTGSQSAITPTNPPTATLTAPPANEEEPSATSVTPSVEADSDPSGTADHPVDEDKSGGQVPNNGTQTRPEDEDK